MRPTSRFSDTFNSQIGNIAMATKKKATAKKKPAAKKKAAKKARRKKK